MFTDKDTADDVCQRLSSSLNFFAEWENMVRIIKFAFLLGVLVGIYLSVQSLNRATEIVVTQAATSVGNSIALTVGSALFDFGYKRFGGALPDLLPAGTQMLTNGIANFR